MKNKRGKRTFLFLLCLLIFCIIVFGGYYFIKERRNPFAEIINNLRPDDNESNDNYNGIYSYYDDLNGSKYIFKGCSVSKIYNYILIMDDEFYTFRSSCMGTYPKEHGNTNDLVITLSEEHNTYVINYNDHTYVKDFTAGGISPNNNIAKKLDDIELSSYQLVMKETQFEGNYYDIKDHDIRNASSDLTMSIIRKEDNSFDLTINGKSGGSTRVLYSYNIHDMDRLPDMYTYGKNLAVIEKEDNETDVSRYGYNLKFISSSGIIYNLNEMFPIIIDDITLNMDNSVYITFDAAERCYRLIVGYDKKLCESNPNDNNKNEIAYYEFKIKYNYQENNFSKPEFVKIGYKSEGCNYINKVLGR